MEFELWWLLSWPFFFLLGWLAARIDIRHIVKESRSLPRSYLTGLNFLLNEQPDKALDAFIEAAKIDPQTVELHFALGSLFRRRGEVDRAIRMHQNLVDRDDLNVEQRLQALEALGQDFLKAGLLDRAEAVYVRLRETPKNEIALKYLLEIYQQEKDWHRAIEIARALPDQTSYLWQKEVANFYCELAAQQLAHSDFAACKTSLDEALRINRKCVRANILLGDLYATQKQDEDALNAWKKIEQQDPLYLALVAERMMDAFRRLGRAEQGIQLLKSYLEQQASLDMLDAVFQWEMEKQTPQVAYEWVRDELKRNPTLLGLEKLLTAAVHTAPVDKRTDVELVKSLIHSHTRRVARYCCQTCGFKTRQFYWHCPACGGWETYPPKRSEEFDLEP